jgi:DNA repair protein RadC
MSRGFKKLPADLSETELFTAILGTDAAAKIPRGSTIAETIENAGRYTGRLQAARELGRRIIEEQRAKETPRIRAAEDVYHRFEPRLSGQVQEHFYAIFLNTKNSIIGEKLISIGTLNEALIHPRDVFRAAISASAAGVLLIHNHPSGDPAPSKEDRALTLRFKSAAELLGIELVDHVVIGAGRYISMKDEGAF